MWAISQLPLRTPFVEGPAENAAPQHLKPPTTAGRRTAGGTTHVGVGEHVASLTPAEAPPSFPRRCVFSRASRLHGHQPYQADTADSITTPQAAKSLTSFLHVSEQFSERSRIFYSQKPPTSPPLHTLMHTFSHAANARPASTSSKWRLSPQNVSESWLGKS